MRSHIIDAMNKIQTLARVAKISAATKKAGKKVGLITGCFDVIHAGHVDLFRFAKKHCDLVIVGLDSDETIKINKGSNRPIHNIFQREKVLAEFESVDLVFEINKSFDFGTELAQEILSQITKKIKPDYLVTNPLADRFWKEKKMRGEKFGARLLTFRKRPSSTTFIAQKIQGEI